MDSTGVRSARRSAYSIAETAEQLGVHPNTVRNWIDAGRLTAVRPVAGGRVLIVAGSIDALLLTAPAARSARGEHDA